MLITMTKPTGEILSAAQGKSVVICCEGCREVYFPDAGAAEVIDELQGRLDVTAVVVTDYICNPDNLRLGLDKYKDKAGAAEGVIVFSCGVGVQTVAEAFKGKNVISACDTYPLPGSQGVTPLEYNCDECGECYLNGTGGICPITACSKSLLNGQCGGAKGGMCEVDGDMECGWERIYRRLEQLKAVDISPEQVKIRSY